MSKLIPVRNKRERGVCSRLSLVSSGEDRPLLLDFDSDQAYGTLVLPAAGPCGDEARLNPDERAMGSTASGSTVFLHAIGAVLPPDIENNRDGGSRAGVGGH